MATRRRREILPVGWRVYYDEPPLGPGHPTLSRTRFFVDQSEARSFAAKADNAETAAVYLWEVRYHDRGDRDNDWTTHMRGVDREEVEERFYENNAATGDDTWMIDSITKISG